MASKGQRQFRAVRDGKAFAIESCVDGSTNWQPGITGLDENQVYSQLSRLKRVGKKIVNTADYKFKE